MPINHQEVQQLNHLELIARQVVEGFITGLHKSPFHGFSVEFAEHRLYNTGESTRHIDWKLYGRTDKLFVKRYEEETNLRCQIIIDNSSSMHFPESVNPDQGQHNKISFSVYCAAAIMHLLKMQRDAIGLSIFSDKLDEHTPARSSTLHQKLMFMKLEEALKSGGRNVHRKTAAAQALHQVAETIHRRSMVVLFSDMFENAGSDPQDLFSALQHLKYNKHEVILFHVTDKRLEQDFGYDNRPYKFIDLETGETVKVHSSRVRETYLERMREYLHELKLRCAQYRIDLVEADIREGYRQVLMPYLIRRQKMS